METNNNEIDDLFKGIIEPFEMSHSDKVWESLNYQLEKRVNKKNKMVIFRLRIALTTLLFLFGLLTFYHFFISGHNNKSLIASNEKIKENNRNPNEKSNSTLYKNQNLVSEIISLPTKVFAAHKKATIVQIQKNEKVANPAGLKISELSTSESLNNSLAKKNEIPVNNSTNKTTIPSNLQSEINESVVDIVNKNNINETSFATNSLDSNSFTSNNIIVGQLVKTTFTIPILSKEKIDSIQKTQLKHRLSVITYFSPDLTMKYLKDNDNMDNQNEGDYNSKEASDFSFNTSLLIGYDITKQWSVKFGGTYAYLSQTIKPKTVYAKTGADGLSHYQFSTTYGTSDIRSDQSLPPSLGDSLNINSSSVQSLQVISIPFIGKYQIIRKKFNYYAQMGLSVNFLAGERLMVEMQNKPLQIDKIQGLNEYFFAGIFGFGISYNPTKKISILLEPTIKGAITPINNNTPISTRPISIGIALGLGWHF